MTYYNAGVIATPTKVKKIFPRTTSESIARAVPLLIHLTTSTDGIAKYSVKGGKIIRDLVPTPKHPMYFALNIAAAMAAILIAFGLVFGIAYPSRFTGALFPIGLTIWWLIGIAAKRIDNDRSD